MSCNVVVKPLAERDATAAYDYYESLISGLGSRFLGELDHVLALIAEHPEMYQEVLPGVRRAATQRKSKERRSKLLKQSRNAQTSTNPWSTSEYWQGLPREGRPGCTSTRSRQRASVTTATSDPIY